VQSKGNVLFSGLKRLLSPWLRYSFSNDAVYCPFCVVLVSYKTFVSTSWKRLVKHA